MNKYFLLVLLSATATIDQAHAKAKGKEKPPAAVASLGSNHCKKPVAPACSGDKVSLGMQVLTPYTQSAGDAPALAAADVDNDGKTDLLVSHTSGLIDVLISKGDGTFELKKPIEQRVAGYGLVLADFDHDCNVDIAASSFGTHSVGRYVDLLKGKGNGRFGLPEPFDVTVDNVVDMFGAELNGDGKTDLVYSGNGSGTPGLSLNTGKGFSLPARVEELSSWGVGDVTGDGIADLINTEGNNPPQTCVLANTGRGTFKKAGCYPLAANARPREIVVADLNGDGKNDVVVVTEENQRYYNVFANLGGGKLDDRERYKISGVVSAFRVADANMDGKADLVSYSAISGGGLSVLVNKGDGSFAAEEEKYPFGSESSRATEVLVVGDFLGNGLNGFATIERLKDGVMVMPASCQ